MVKRSCEGTWKLSTCQPRSQCFSLLFYLLFFTDWNAVVQYHTIQCLLIFCNTYHRQHSVCFTEASRSKQQTRREKPIQQKQKAGIVTSLNDTTLTMVTYGKYATRYFIIHQRHKFLPGLILLKLKHASNRPVYFRDLCAAYSALPQKSSLIIFQRTYANLLRSKITQNDKISQNVEISQKSFPAKHLLKQTTYLLLEAKHPSYFNCLRANETHNRCHRAYAIK